MMLNANIPPAWKPIVAQKEFETATKLDGLVPIDIDGIVKARVEHWSGKLPQFAKHLRKWGEVGIVKTKQTGTPKMSDRGLKCMFVGYAGQHAGDNYEMLNLTTKRILIT